MALVPLSQFVPLLSFSHLPFPPHTQLLDNDEDPATALAPKQADDDGEDIFSYHTTKNQSEDDLFSGLGDDPIFTAPYG